MTSRKQDSTTILLEFSNGGFKLTEKFDSELRRLLEKDYSRASYQDKFIRPLAFGMAHFTELDEHTENVCDSHYDERGDPIYCMKYFRDRGSQYDFSNMANLTKSEEFRYTREYEAQKRWLDSVLCEASRKAMTNDRTYGSENMGEKVKTTLSYIFDVHSTDRFILITKDLFPKHITSYLSHVDLLSLGLTCKTMNNLINNNTLMGLAIRMVREYSYLTINNNLSPSLPNIETLLISMLDKSIRISSDIFTNYSRQFNTEHMEIILAYDSGDAMVADSYEEGNMCNVSIESRKLFYIRCYYDGISAYFNIALVLSRRYGLFRNKSWECRGESWEQTIPVKAKAAKISKLKARIDIQKVVHNIDMPDNERTELLDNLYHNDPVLFDLGLATLLKDVNFSHEGNLEKCIPIEEGSMFILLSLRDLMIFGNKSKIKILDVLEVPKDLNDDDDFELLQFARLEGLEEFNEGLRTISYDPVKRLTDIAFGRAGGAFMHLWFQTKESEINKYLLTGLPLSDISKLRFPPKEWSADDPYGTPDYDGVEEHTTYWHQFFMRKNTTNEGNTIFEN